MAMIALDREGERFAFENEWDILLPLSITVMAGEEIRVTAVPRISRTVRGFLKKYGDTPLSDAAQRDLRSRLEESADALAPYRLTKHSFCHANIYRAKEPPAPSPLARALHAEDEERNGTSYDIRATIEAGRLAYGVEAEGRIVAIAVSHAAPSEAEGLLEVGVETIPAYRGRGFARAAVASLSAQIISLGLTPEYRARQGNRASCAVARAAGFTKCGESLDVVLRR